MQPRAGLAAKCFSKLPLALWAALLYSPLASAQQLPPETRSTPNPSGLDAAFSGTSFDGAVDLSHPFFQPIAQANGGNARSCGSCHRPEQGWSITPEKIQLLFNLTEGLDPIFLPVDGTNAPNSDRSTLEARRQASSLLLSKGLIRVERPVLSTFQFELIDVSVPANESFPANFTTQSLNRQVITVFRRPPPISNLIFLTDLMWDGREAIPNRSLNDRLIQQAINASRGHLEWTNLAFAFNGLSPEQKLLFEGIVDFERSIFAAQAVDIVGASAAGALNERGAFGGPQPIFAQPPEILQGGTFNLFAAWGGLGGNPLDAESIQDLGRQQIARGEVLFNTRTFQTGIVGTATCATCHGVRAVGNEQTGRRFNLGLSAPNITLGGVPRNLDLPVYTIRHKINRQVIRTTDPGRIMATGTFGTGDGDSFKVPSLRNLAARAPYFHGGQASDLTMLVNFYNNRFSIRLSEQERADLVAFLRSL